MYNLLAGVKILDLTTIVLGPYATQFMGDFGADVVKVEAPAGDLFRSVGPARNPGMGAAFLNCNRNKRSIVLDLANTEDRDALYRLVRGADVFVHNMRNNSAVKLGLSYQQIRVHKPDIVYCSAGGFGSGGSYADQPAYDDTLQAASGIASLNRDADGVPRYVPSVICDKIAGMHLAMAMLAGIAARDRSGEGVAIETPMFESMAAFLLLEHMAGETFEPALGGMGYARMMTPFRKPFATRDGYISVLPYTGAHWQRFLRLIGADELALDPRVTDAVLRSQSLDMLYAVVAEACSAKTSGDWLAELRRQDIPCAPVNQLEDLLTDPHLAGREFFQRVEHPSEGWIRNIGSAFTVTGAAHQPDRPAPALGADAEVVLAEAGFSVNEIARLLARAD